MTGKLFGPVMRVRASNVFLRTQRYIVQFGIRQPCNCLLALLFTELHRHFDCLYYGHNSALCPVWTSNLQFYDYYSMLYQTEPHRCLTLHNKMFLVSVWHIQVLCNVYIFLFFYRETVQAYQRINNYCKLLK